MISKWIRTKQQQYKIETFNQCQWIIKIFEIHKLQSKIHQTIFAQNVIVDKIDTKKSTMKLKQ